MTTYEEMKQGIVNSDNPAPVEAVLGQELPSAAAQISRPRPKSGLLVNLVVGGFLAAAVCVGSLLVINNLNAETPKQAKGKQSSSSLWKLLGFNTPATGAKKKNKKKVIFGPGANFDGAFDLKPQSVPVMDPLDGFSNFN